MEDGLGAKHLAHVEDGVRLEDRQQLVVGERELDVLLPQRAELDLPLLLVHRLEVEALAPVGDGGVVAVRNEARLEDAQVVVRRKRGVVAADGDRALLHPRRLLPPLIPPPQPVRHDRERP